MRETSLFIYDQRINTIELFKIMKAQNMMRRYKTSRFVRIQKVVQTIQSVSVRTESISMIDVVTYFDANWDPFGLFSTIVNLICPYKTLDRALLLVMIVCNG